MSVFISADLNDLLGSTTRVVLWRASPQPGPAGDPAAESLRATQEELSPAEERLSSCPGLHLCRLACLSADLTGKERRALGGFGREWEPTSHLHAVNALKGSVAFGISPEARDGR